MVGAIGLRATIKDVAAAAGVSIKTVSRVLNNERYVGGETREKVQASVAALGFRPNVAARALAGRRGGLVALLHAADAAHAMPGVLAGVQARCAADGVRVLAMACSAGAEAGAGAGADDALALVAAVSLDGVVLLSPLTEDAALLAALEGRGVRVVRVSPAEAGAFPKVGPEVAVDDARAAATMTRHLLTLGHRRIAFVGATDARAGGHRAALAAAGIADDPALFVAATDAFAGGVRAGAALLELAEPPTAVFAGSDMLAAGVLTAAHARGLRVPEDVSVAGFGDAPLAAYVWPPLTTIRVSARALGEAAADLVLTGIDERRTIGFDLIERASVVGTGI